MSGGQSLERSLRSSSRNLSSRALRLSIQSLPWSAKEALQANASTFPNARSTLANRRADTPIVSLWEAGLGAYASNVSPSQRRSKGSRGSPGNVRPRSAHSALTGWTRRGSPPPSCSTRPCTEALAIALSTANFGSQAPRPEGHALQELGRNDCRLPHGPHDPQSRVG